MIEMENKSLFKILKKVNVDCKNLKDEWINKDRLNVIEKLLINSAYERINVGEDEQMLAHLYAKTKILKDQKYVLISTHVDTVPSLTNFFTKRVNGGLIHGTLDNSLTNAVTVFNMLQNSFADNVIISFTGDEENIESNIGANQTIEFLNKHNINISTYIVLDVTWDKHVGSEATIENMSLNKQNLSVIDNFVNSINTKTKIVHDNFFDDETQTYKSGECFSFCIPVIESKNMHSNDGCMVKENMLVKYSNALTSLVNYFTKVNHMK